MHDGRGIRGSKEEFKKRKHGAFILPGIQDEIAAI